MTDVCDLVTDNITAANAGAHSVKALTVEQSSMSSAFIATMATLVSNGISATDAATQRFASMVTESAALATQDQHSASCRNLVSDAAGIGSVILSSYIVTVSSSAALTNASSHSLSALSRDSASASTSTAQALLARSVVVDAAEILDICPPFMTNYVVDSIAAGNAVSTLNTATSVVSDSAEIGDAVSTRGLYRQTVEDSAAMSTTFTATLSASNTVSDDAFILDETTGPAGGAWTALGETWGMSRYTNMPFNSIAAIGGVTVLAGQDGFYTLNAANDGGAAIQATVDLGESEGKGAMIRRPREVYVGFKGGALNVRVTGAPQGVNVSYTYPFGARVATDFVTGKAEPGRGLESRYFRFAFTNQAGSAFTIRDARIMFDDTRKRI